MEVWKRIGAICAIDFNAMCVKPSSNSMFGTLWPDGGSESVRDVPAAMDAICVFSTSSFDRRSPKLKLDSNIIVHFVWHQPQTIAFQCHVCQTFDCIALQEIFILGTFEEIYTIPSKDKAFVDGFVWANVVIYFSGKTPKPSYTSNICHKYT